MSDLECRRAVNPAEEKLFDAVLNKLDITKNSIVTLTIPAKGNRWGIPRINKLAAAVRKRGGDLAVIREGETLDVSQEETHAEESANCVAPGNAGAS